MDFFNSYQDRKRANDYAKLEFHNDYYLAFRDLPTLFQKYANGKKAIDFGCGTGRSTRFLQKQGFDTIGIDISEEMIEIAKKIDPNGIYYLIKDGEYQVIKPQSYDLILSAFTFDNIPQEKKVSLLDGLINLLQKDGIFVNLVSSPEMYTHEWASFSTKDYPKNKQAQNGDIVPIITKDFDDTRPCYDVFCNSEEYQRIYKKVGLKIIHIEKPRANGSEPYEWINETRIAPWTIYVLHKKFP
jgi:ubiquinone/menaquinone biosynthesis C-methylase UbiE